MLGALIFLFSLAKGVVRNLSDWEYWVIGGLGLLGIAAPFVLGFAGSTLAMAIAW